MSLHYSFSEITGTLIVWLLYLLSTLLVCRSSSTIVFDHSDFVLERSVSFEIVATSVVVAF